MFDTAPVSLESSARGDKKYSSLCCSVFGPSGIGLPEVEETAVHKVYYNGSSHITCVV